MRYVLEGSIQRSGNRVRITAQLIDATTGYHLWAERYDREVRDIFALQDEVTREIVRALAVKLTEGEQGRIARAPTGNLEAYDLVLRGRAERRRTTRESNAEARRLFVKALDLDPEYAPAYVGLSWAHLQSWRFLWTTGPETMERAQELAERAIALDDTLANAHSLLGQLYLWRKEHDQAIAEAERAVALAPKRRRRVRDARRDTGVGGPGFRTLRSRQGHRNPMLRNNPTFVQLAQQQDAALLFASALYPPNPVSKGDTWRGTLSIPVPPDQHLGLSLTSKLESVADQDARISYSGTVTGFGQGDVHGQAMIDMATGWPKTTELTLRYQIPGQPGSVEHSVRQETSRIY